MPGKVGITTTVPIEVIYAAGLTPVDLNNRFIGSADPKSHTERAEADGIPRNVCGWIKGLYGVAMTSPDVETVVGVTQGDCSNTHALMELLERAGKRVIPFSYPYDADRELLKLQIEEFMDAFGVDAPAVARTKERLDRIRRKLVRLDELTWREHRLTGGENHLWLVSASDMNGDPDRFEVELDAFLTEAESREPRREPVLLGYAGVPAIFSNLYDFLESVGARVVFNEMQRQFAMLNLQRDVVEQYRTYTYPYRVWGRTRDIRGAVEERDIVGLIHYVQSFCYRQMQDVILREELEVPVLTLEGDLPGPLDARSQVRLESFVEMLH
ncbi:MAG: 2-hydroxyglutaryl-CoA dehydratase [Planctomycetes bacterium DG_58]|nr:MAG: 2-hydroxyglutaryl-CoA dehydratase [Planctomycetes bacterium DG_58]